MRVCVSVIRKSLQIPCHMFQKKVKYETIKPHLSLLFTCILADMSFSYLFVYVLNDNLPGMLVSQTKKSTPAPPLHIG